MGEPQFVEGKVVGELDRGVFTQRIYTRHIYRRLNAKGMDTRLHQALRGKCRLWRLIFGDTGQVLSIPYGRIEVSGTRADPRGGMVEQIFVPLQYFDKERDATQRRMI